MKEKAKQFRELYNRYKQGDETALTEMTAFINENKDFQIGINRFLYAMIGKDALTKLRGKGE